MVAYHGILGVFDIGAGEVQFWGADCVVSFRVCYGLLVTVFIEVQILPGLGFRV